MMLVIKLVSLLTMIIQILGIPNQDSHSISYALGSDITVCLRTVEYRNCSHPAMKLNFHQTYSKHDVGTLLYSIGINPDKLVKRINTTKFGFRNVTNRRNTTHICLHFIEMNMFANRQKYTMDEICGFGYLHDEFRHWITFWLGGCDGTTKSERITETNSKYTHVMPGNQAVVQWAWCVAVNSTITNISIYKVTRFKSRTTNHMVLSIDVLEKVNYARDNSKHELFSVKKKARFQARAIFVINNVSEADDGEYSIRIRRIGYRDLHNEVKIFVNPREPAAQKPATTITNNPEPSAHTLATIITNTPAIKGRKSESLSPLYIGLIVAGAIIVFFGLLICYKCRRAHCPLLTRWWERFRIYMGCCFLLS